jgi:hypothetical protein
MYRKCLPGDTISFKLLFYFGRDAVNMADQVRILAEGDNLARQSKFGLKLPDAEIRGNPACVVGALDGDQPCGAGKPLHSSL